MRVPVPWVFVATYLAGVGLQSLIPIRFFAPIAKLAGIVLLAAGIALAAWCLWIFRKARTTTTPGETSRTLVTWGPYRFSRNPMYVSLCLAYLGEAGILSQFWPIVLLPFTLAYLNWIVIPVEEGKLQAAFPAQYERYRARVRRWI